MSYYLGELGKGLIRPMWYNFSSRGDEMGKTWFAIEAKTFEISIEEKGKKLRGCIWERCKGATSWVRFRDSSLQHLLLGIKDCDKISRNQDWFANWEEEGRRYKLE